MSDTWRVLGRDTRMDGVVALAPQAIQDATPVLSAAIDLSVAYPRQTAIAWLVSKETTGTAHTIGLTVTESATTDGEYTAASTSGTMTGLSADGMLLGTFKRNPAKPFVKLTLTGSNADAPTSSCRSTPSWRKTTSAATSSAGRWTCSSPNPAAWTLWANR